MQVKNPIKLEILIADFENGFGSWKRGGNAFENTNKNSNDIKSVQGYLGIGLGIIIQ